MTGVLEGFATIAVVIAVGWLLAHLGILDDHGPERPDPAGLLRRLAGAARRGDGIGRSLSAVLLGQPRVVPGERRSSTVGVYLALEPVEAGRPRSGRGRIGSAVARPTSTPATSGSPSRSTCWATCRLSGADPAHAAAAHHPGGHGPARRRCRGVSADRGPQPAAGSCATPITRRSPRGGSCVSAVRSRVPDLVLQPVELLGNLAVPAMLIAFGISLRRGPRPGAGGSWGHVGHPRRPQAASCSPSPRWRSAPGCWACGVPGSSRPP